MNKFLMILADFDFSQISLDRITIEDDVGKYILYIVFNGGYFIQMNISMSDLLKNTDEEVITQFKQMFDQEFKALKVRSKSFKDTKI